MRAVAMYLVMFCALAITGCKKKDSGGSGASTGSAPVPAQSGFLTVGAYCSAFCNKLCGTCGAPNCAEVCPVRCHFGRSPDQLLDGKDPKTALALNQQNLDACLATITKDSCETIAAGNVPPVCYTIQH